MYSLVLRDNSWVIGSLKKTKSRNVAGLCDTVYILVLHDSSGIFSGEKVEILQVYAAECGLVKVESNIDYAWSNKFPGIIEAYRCYAILRKESDKVRS